MVHWAASQKYYLAVSQLIGGLHKKTVRINEMDYYEIIVQGFLDARRADRFEGLELMPLHDGNTLIAGLLRDQAELHTMLSRSGT